VRDNYGLWREVFLLAVGQAGVGDAVDAVDVLCSSQWPNRPEGWRQLILAGQGLNEIGLPKVRSDERGPEVERRVTRFLERAMRDIDPHDQPNDPPVVPVPTRYAAGETLDRLGWLPDDLDDWVEVGVADTESQAPGPVYVARYPVTNAQFARFIDAGGYEDERWWIEAIGDGRWARGQIRDWRGQRSRPRFWDDSRFGRSRRGYPVVGVCWYEAVAYCRWLAEEFRTPSREMRVWRGGKPETCNLKTGTLTVRLPTEEEWVAAAGGDAGQRYPWEGDWGESRANTREGGIGGTTPVGMYPSGQSPAGVWDMGGNVWEWTASWIESAGPYALRGGSWDGDLVDARVSGRSGSDPDDSDDYVGFRVVGSPASSGS
jgi:formylglycine-generating enzyme required for sulfatase activity